MSTISASRVQIAVELSNATTAQAAFDTACPNVYDVSSSARTLWANSSDPYTPAWAVAQGDIDQVQYAELATLALAAGINHLSIGAWIDGIYVPAPQNGTLWAALSIMPVQDPEEE